MIEDFINEKRMNNILVFDDIYKLVKIKYFKIFIIIQNLLFSHQTYNLNKQIVIYIILESL